MSVCDFVTNLFLELRNSFILLAMPRFIVPPKYIYTQGTGNLFISVPGFNSNPGNNGMFNYSTLFGTSAFDDLYIIAPTPTLPSIGNGHDCRTHSKITVTTLRWKITLNLMPSIVERGQFMDSDHAPTNFPTDPQYQFPPNPNQFYKFRYFMVEFDEDIPISPPVIYNWFYSTYCFYRDPNVTPVQKLPNDTDRHSLGAVIPGPISVHSNILRVTTPWVGKFKVLADKCFTISSHRPRVTIDLTVPINRVFTWNDETVSFDQSTALISPHIYCFIMPPLSFEQDMGPFDTKNISSFTSSQGTSTHTTQIVKWESWMKLNFVDI